MSEPQETEPPVILAPNGRPARGKADTACPNCRAGKDKRTVTGYGVQHDVCASCGYEWPEVTA